MVAFGRQVIGIQSDSSDQKEKAMGGEEITNTQEYNVCVARARLHGYEYYKGYYVSWEVKRARGTDSPECTKKQAHTEELRTTNEKP